jgi:hypothetical protein
MSVTTTQATSAIDSLARTLLQTFDGDRNGVLSADEFSGLLRRLLAPTGPMTGTVGAAAPSVSSPAAASTFRTPVSDMSAAWNMAKFNDPNHTSFKYQIGRILQYYPHTPAGLQQALAEIQQLVPGARIVGSNGDKIDFGSYNDPKSGLIGVVDVLQSAGTGGTGWQWAPVGS